MINTKRSSGPATTATVQAQLNSASWTTGNPTMPRRKIGETRTASTAGTHYNCTSCSKSVSTYGDCSDCRAHAQAVDAHAMRFLSTLEVY